MTNRGTAFATTVRVIAGVHDRATAAGTNAHVALAASLAQVDVLVVEVRNNADGSDAVQTNVTHLAGGQTNQSVTIFLSHQLSHDASGTDQLAALAGIQLNVMDHGTDGDVLEGQSVTGLDVGVGAGHNLVANLQTIGSQDVALDAVLILDEGDEGRTVRIVLQSLDSGRYIKLVALEVDDTVLDAVAAAVMADGDLAGVVAAAACFFLDSSRLRSGSTLDRTL